jgi:hypothetical protein
MRLHAADLCNLFDQRVEYSDLPGGNRALYCGVSIVDHPHILLFLAHRQPRIGTMFGSGLTMRSICAASASNACSFSR